MNPKSILNQKNYGV